MDKLDRLALRTKRILAEMLTEEFEYMRCIILANAEIHSSKNVYNFMRTVFELAQNKRPLQIIMKSDAV